MLIIPEELLEDNEYFESPRNKWKKVLKSSIIPIMIIIIFTGISSSIISHLKFNNEHKFLYNSSCKRELIANNDVEDIIYDEIFNNLYYTTYSGEWKSDTISSYVSNEGLIFMQLASNWKRVADSFNVNIRILKGKYIDNWMIIQSEISIEKIIFDNKTNEFLFLKGEFNSQASTGELFDHLSSNTSCKSNISLKFPKKEDHTINYEKIVGIIHSNCFNSDIEFNVIIKDEKKDDIAISSYSCIISVVTLLSILNTLWINHKLNESQSYAKSISLCTIYQNIIWNSYGCLCHFYLTINYSKHFVRFIIPTILYFISFALTDLRFLYSLWLLKYNNILGEPQLTRRKLYQLYVILYLILFFSLLYIIKFYFSKPYILVEIMLTWLPQIAYNAYYNNKISMPISYLLFISFYRVFIPCYFRVNENNFLMISPDIGFVIICTFIMTICVLFMYTQIIFVPRWFLCDRFKRDVYNYYKTKEELIQLKPDSENTECVICLYPLFSDENAKFFANTTTDLENIPIMRGGSLKYTKILKLCDKCSYLFDFHEKNFNQSKKLFMITPCHHAFHTRCLESWFQRKRECPNCRADLLIE